MATNAALYGVIQPSGDITGRVLVALVKKAWAVLAEVDTVNNHTNRLALARKVITNPENYSGIAWRMFLSNDTAQGYISNAFATVTDNDLDWVFANDAESKVYDRMANLIAAQGV